ncbi:TPR-like protein [Trichodelitschia bisporula]|uniref:TPR-like protein n=1 Tax=Trichodelitschia bisporula TaxID=703511 RepID=A0A6G1I0X7_9PEZI|nr:TPR-like protein [Trichodelitschia bisporula]
MSDPLLQYFRKALPEELAGLLGSQVNRVETAQFRDILEEPLVRVLLGHEHNSETQNVQLKDFSCWSDYIFHRLGLLLGNRQENAPATSEDTPAYRQHLFFLVALASLGAFLQSNVTGPPLPFSSAKVLLPEAINSDSASLAAVRLALALSLTVDGEAAYKLTPNLELLCLADTILTSPPISKHIKPAKWARIRVNFIHQRLLSANAPTLQQSVYDGLKDVEALISDSDPESDLVVSFLLERATIHTHHGFDKLAREDLEKAAKLRHFEFALTGLLGKRTRYQQKDISQLVVLARSADSSITTLNGDGEARPKALDLNDDTLLESISFSERPKLSTDIQDETSLPPSLASIDPENQPQLHPLDSIILLSLASSITNTAPENGLTREETLPYATRVLEGGSSNWQVYSQALLIRSRIEGYKSRTIERGLLQLQAIVDQVIAETTSLDDNAPAPSTFLPRPKDSESAPADIRLLYIYALASPTRWGLEAELAAKWVSLGGLRSALEIYERLQMWAEAALCLAATEREDKARRMVRRQLFHPTAGPDAVVDPDSEAWTGPPREPAPAEAPRLYCILGDMDKDPEMYETAWRVSNQRYARAQRSLARYWYEKRDHAKASLAYSRALKVQQLDHSTWFAYGCVLLELGKFKRAAEAFSRAVQLDDGDAESWSNLAAALLHQGPQNTAETKDEPLNDTLDEESAPTTPTNPQKYKIDALKALKHASRLKHDSYRIWDNVLTVAASLDPPSWSDIVTAQRRIIDLRGATDGEKCIDVRIVAATLNHVASLVADTPPPAETEADADGPADPLNRPGLPRMLVQMFTAITPLITASAPLWHLVARLARLRNRPGAALVAEEKAWRAVVNQPGWEHAVDEGTWKGVVNETLRLVEAYRGLGPLERTEGLGAGAGELVCKEWRFKARSAVRSVLGRAKVGVWEGSEGWEGLQEGMEALKG